MKNKYLFSSVILVVISLMMFFVVYQNDDTLVQTSPDPEVKPIVVAQKSTTIAGSTTTEKSATESSNPSETSQKLTADDVAPSNPPQPVRTNNAPKQTEVRQSVDREYVYRALVASNDPAYTDSWALQKVNAPAAWDIATGNSQTVVAVIDTGFFLEHEDLVGQWVTNSAETGQTQSGDICWTGVAQDKQTNNCDDDENGYDDDWRGWNFYLGDNDVTPGRTDPQNTTASHGTSVAGLAGAAGNNNTGIATINWDTKLMPLQALGDDGSGYTSDIAAAIYYAVDNGADVINMSLGGDAIDPALKTAVEYAEANNVVTIAAAGNDGDRTDCPATNPGCMAYPTLYESVISVGATTQADARASFSSYGKALDVVAPGSGTIYSPVWMSDGSTDYYATSLYGTSFSSPQVASLASLIRSIRPDSSVTDVKALLLASSSKLGVMNGALYTDELGHGIINAGSAMTIASSLNTTTSQPKLWQAGGAKNEHSFASAESLGSGCEGVVDSYCTVLFQNTSAGLERYLPYEQIDPDGRGGWTWPGTFLTDGLWAVRAVQGDAQSNTPYELHKR